MIHQHRSTALLLWIVTLCSVAGAQSRPTDGMTINVEIDYMAVTAGPTPTVTCPRLPRSTPWFRCSRATESHQRARRRSDRRDREHPMPLRNRWLRRRLLLLWLRRGRIVLRDQGSQLRQHRGGWHYCVFGHQYNGGFSSGIAEIGGDDLLVTLFSGAGQNGTPFKRASTFAHELGHNWADACLPRLDGAVNAFQPNYASIMSYQYQLDGIASQMECWGSSRTGCTSSRSWTTRTGSCRTWTRRRSTRPSGSGSTRWTGTVTGPRTARTSRPISTADNPGATAGEHRPCCATTTTGATSSTTRTACRRMRTSRSRSVPPIARTGRAPTTWSIRAAASDRP